MTNPTDAIQLAKTHLSKGNYRDAISVLEPHLTTDNLDVRLLYIQVLIASRDHSTALSSISKYLSQHPYLAETFYGVIANASMDFVSAKKHFTAALLLDKSSVAYRNLCLTLFNLGEYKEASTLVTEALTAHKDPSLLWIAAVAAFKLGRDDIAIPLFDQRPEPVTMPPFFPIWQGEDLKGKTILVWRQPGFADDILTLRYIHALKKLGAAKVNYVTATPMLRIIQDSIYVDQVIDELSPGGFNSMSDPDYLTRPYHIAKYLHLRGIDIYHYDGVLIEPLDSDYQKVLPFISQKTSKHVLINWTEFAEDSFNPLRDIDLDTLISAFVESRQEDTTYYSLVPVSEEVKARLASVGIVTIPLSQDFMHMAAIVAHMTHIVSIDSSVAHIAAAMGKNTTLLLPRASASWYWPVNSESTPWYSTLKISPYCDNWGTTLSKVLRSLP